MSHRSNTAFGCQLAPEHLSLVYRRFDRGARCRQGNDCTVPKIAHCDRHTGFIERTAHKARIGSSFDDFLKQEGTYEATQVVAIKRVLAWQIEKTMRKQRLTRAAMAKRMDTTRSQLDRLLDPSRDSVTLETLTRAARAIGRQLKLELV